jgi:hypothetical protein
LACLRLPARPVALRQGLAATPMCKQGSLTATGLLGARNAAFLCRGVGDRLPGRPPMCAVEGPHVLARCPQGPPCGLCWPLRAPFWVGAAPFENSLTFRWPVLQVLREIFQKAFLALPNRNIIHKRLSYIRTFPEGDRTLDPTGTSHMRAATPMVCLLLLCGCVGNTLPHTGGKQALSPSLWGMAYGWALNGCINEPMRTLAL